jgi:hypothetical protein
MGHHYHLLIAPPSRTWHGACNGSIRSTPSASTDATGGWATCSKFATRRSCSTRPAADSLRGASACPRCGKFCAGRCGSAMSHFWPRCRAVSAPSVVVAMCPPRSVSPLARTACRSYQRI